MSKIEMVTPGNARDAKRVFDMIFLLIQLYFSPDTDKSGGKLSRVMDVGHER